MDLVLWSSPKFGQGGGGPKTGKCCGRHMYMDPYGSSAPYDGF